MPIKIIKNRGINIKRQLLSIKLSINVNSKKGFVFAQKNAARCISGQNKKRNDKVRLLITFQKRKTFGVLQQCKWLIMSCLCFCFGKLCRTVDNFFFEKSCRDGGNVVIL